MVEDAAEEDRELVPEYEEVEEPPLSVEQDVVAVQDGPPVAGARVVGPVSLVSKQSGSPSFPSSLGVNFPGSPTLGG